MLVLTGMNYKNKSTLYEEAKQSLKKFKGDISGGSASLGSSVKLEPAFLAENEEALLAAGYVRQGQGKGNAKSKRGGFNYGGGQRGQVQNVKRMKKVNKQCLLDTPRTVRVSEKTWQVIVQTRRP